MTGRERGRRLALLGLGWLCVGAGIVGVVVPGWPTTVFLLAALWAFARSSKSLHDRLYAHPRLGPPLRDWREHGAISTPAKLAALGFMAVGLAFATATAETWTLPAVLAVILVPVALFIVTRPGAPGR